MLFEYSTFAYVYDKMQSCLSLSLVMEPVSPYWSDLLTLQLNDPSAALPLLCSSYCSLVTVHLFLFPQIPNKAFRLSSMLLQHSSCFCLQHLMWLMPEMICSCGPSCWKQHEITFCDVELGWIKVSPFSTLVVPLCVSSSRVLGKLIANVRCFLV